MLDGKKTYLVALIAILSAATGYFYEGLTLGEALTMALAGSGFATLRHGVKKAER